MQNILLEGYTVSLKVIYLALAGHTVYGNSCLLRNTRRDPDTEGVRGSDWIQDLLPAGQTLRSLWSKLWQKYKNPATHSLGDQQKQKLLELCRVYYKREPFKQWMVLMFPILVFLAKNVISFCGNFRCCRLSKSWWNTPQVKSKLYWRINSESSQGNFVLTC